MKSGRLLLLCLLWGAFLVVGGAALGQTASDSSGLGRVPFFDQPIDPDQYLIRPGERLEVVFINAQLSPLPLTVDAESRIVHPKLGIFDLAGRTLSETRELLLEPLSRLFNADKIDISVRTVYPVSIQVTGAVRKPGRYVGYTSQKVSDIIDSAGGVAPGGSTRNVSFVSGEESLPVDLDRVRFEGDSRLDLNLYAGNRIHVPAASEDQVYVMGEVSDPRSIELLPGDNLELLVALAGGVRNCGDPARAFVVGDTARNLRTVDGIRAGDFIVIPRSADAAEEDAVIVVGAVRKPGRFPWNFESSLDELLKVGLDKPTDRRITVENLISKAGGLTDRANPQRIVVFRRARHELTGMQLAERYPLFLGSSPAGSLALEPADSVVVANLVGFVRVSGAVTNPGVYPYEAGRNAGYYLSLAGGIIKGLEKAEILLRDRVSNLTRAGESRDPVYDGLEIIVRSQEPGQ